jgi:succinyl-diaminopimelate desuccinylase
MHSGTGATNVVPGTAELDFNFRFSTEITLEQLQQRVRQIIDTQLANEEVKSGRVYDYELDWNLSGLPFLTEPGDLVAATIAAIRQELGITAELSTSGGTSDGRFIAPAGAQVIELGPVNATIHKIDECVRAEDLEPLSRVYQSILQNYLRSV